MFIFTWIGIIVVSLVVLVILLCLIPSSVYCFFGLHQSNGVYGGGDLSKKGMKTTCVNCKKSYYADEKWMHMRFG